MVLVEMERLLRTDGVEGGVTGCASEMVSSRGNYSITGSET
jgi:hypothetical protein